MSSEMPQSNPTKEPRDRFGIDDHKIHYHVERVADWLKKEKTVYPLYVEISPSGACNHRCTFCAVDYIGYKPRLLEKNLLMSRISEMAEKGVKSIMFAGEGEPLIHKDLPEIIRHTRAAGIDTAITTNGVLLTEKFLQNSIESITWIKVSLNAGSPETYAKVHQTKADDFHTVVKNLARAVEIRREKKCSVALGAQMVLLPENSHEAAPLSKICRDIGLDYVVIKPYSQHSFSQTRSYEKLQYESYLPLEAELEALTTQNFQVVFRSRTMKSLSENHRYYQTCHATPYFWAYIMANGDVYGCSAYLQDDRFCYGNLNQNTFTEIWEGEKRKKNQEYVEKELDISTCRKNCRMEKVNRYLWDLKNPREHSNFI